VYNIIIVIIIINCKWVYTWWQCTTMPDRTIQVQYSTVQYNKITQSHTTTYNTQGKCLYAKLQKKKKNTVIIIYLIFQRSTRVDIELVNRLK
jgi:hypothetical protein